MTDDRLKTESAGRLGGDCREVARRAGVEVGGVRACRSIILAEPGAAGFAGIAAFGLVTLRNEERKRPAFRLSLANHIGQNRSEAARLLLLVRPQMQNGPLHEGRT
jgi:hypothetical protein